MNLKEVREYVEKLLTSYFKPKVLKKLDENTDGILMYDNSQIVSKISSKTNNAIELLPDNPSVSGESGLWVDGTTIKNISIAQKTINELGYDELLNSKPTFVAPLNNATGNINKVITLDKPITDYEFIEIYVSADNSTAKRQSQITKLKVSDIVYNTATTSDKQDKSVFNIQYSLNSAVNIGGDATIVVKAWFIDATHLFLYQSSNPQSNSWNTFKFEHILGINKEVITIDPVNYIDGNQTIQDNPVGHIITMDGMSNPPHYLLCDNAEYNIADYKDLAEYFLKTYGKYNYYGGDGVTTFRVPNRLPSNSTWWSPGQTSATTPYRVWTDSDNSNPNYTVWSAFNGTAIKDGGYHSAQPVASFPCHISIDFGTAIYISGIRIYPRSGNYGGILPRNFDLQGSNDGGTTWETIQSFVNTNTANGGVREFNITNSNNNSIVVGYKAYRLLMHDSNSQNIINISCINFKKVEPVFQYIKYKPTYFIGSINGYEQIDEILSTPIKGPFTAGKDLQSTSTNAIKGTLLKPFTDYDELEIVYILHWGTQGQTKRILRINTKDIELNPQQHYYNNCFNIPWVDGNEILQFNFGFKDATTLYAARATYLGSKTEYNYEIQHVRGIVRHYTVKSTT